METTTQDLSPELSEQPLAPMNSEIVQRPGESNRLLSSLFGQVAASTVRNIVDDGVATLDKLDKLLSDRVAQFTERRKELKIIGNEDEREHVLQVLQEQEREQEHQREGKKSGDCGAYHLEGDTQIDTF